MSYRLLLVDDEPNVRRALRRSLRGQEYEILEAGGPEEAVEILRGRPVDVVISDLAMPGMGGIEFIKLVRFRWPDCVRIILTGNADLETAIQAINDGSVHRFLRKPWDTVDVNVMIRLCLRNLEAARENERLLATIRETHPLVAAATVAVAAAAPRAEELVVEVDDEPVPAAAGARPGSTW